MKTGDFCLATIKSAHQNQQTVVWEEKSPIRNELIPIFGNEYKFLIWSYAKASEV